MSKRILILIAVASFISSSLAQDYHSTYQDVYSTENENATSMHSLNDDEHIILGNGTCDNRSQSCLHYYKVGTDGSMIDSIQYPHIIGAAHRTSIDDDYLYVSGYQIEDTLEYDRYRLYKMTHDGEVLESAKHNISELAGDTPSDPQYPIYAYVPYGTVIYEDKVIVYGQTLEYDAVTEIETVRGLMMWYNKIDLSYDTMVFLQPLHDRIEIWDAEVGPDGMLNLLFNYNVENSPFDDHYRSFVKYNSSGDEVYRWIDPPVLESSTNIHIPFTILEDNSVITYIKNESLSTYNDIIRVSAEGDILWRNRVDTRHTYDWRKTVGFIKTNDGNVISVGAYSSLSELLLSGFIYKIDVDTGEILWERAYVDRTTSPYYRTDFSQNGFLWNINELSDNSLVLSGTKFRYLADNLGNDDRYTDLWLLHVDEDGCIEGDCGGQIQIIAGDPYFSPMMHPGAIWYYQNPTADGGIIKESYIRFNLGSGMLRTEKYLDLRDDFIYEDNNRILFYVTDDNMQHYWLLDGDSILVYDFSLELGDTFESAYSPHKLTVIETDTMRLTNKAKRQYWVLASEEHPEHTLTWIQGLGTYHGVLWPPDFPSGEYGDDLLNCYYLNEQFYHINPAVPHCRATGLVSVDETEIDISPIIVYPNPASDILQVVLADSGIYSYSVTSMDGRTILTCTSNDASKLDVDISNLESGMYLIRLHKEEQSYVSKFIKAN